LAVSLLDVIGIILVAVGLAWFLLGLTERLWVLLEGIFRPISEAIFGSSFSKDYSEVSLALSSVLIPVLFVAWGILTIIV
jgi:hypothetical protein